MQVLSSQTSVVPRRPSSSPPTTLWPDPAATHHRVPSDPGQGEFTQQAARPPQPAQTYRSPRTTTPTCAGWALHVEGPPPHLHCHSGASPPCPVKRPLLPLSEPWASRSFIPIPQHQHREDPGLGDVPGPPPSEPLGFRLLAHSHQGTEPVGQDSKVAPG